MPEPLPDSSVLTVKPVDPTSRHKMGRSLTSNLSSPPISPQQHPRTTRSQSQDSVTQSATADKRRHHKAKKGSMHADVIDRLDFTGMGAAMFHHDGPFDACAPSRNRHRTKAPMLSWSNSTGGSVLPSQDPYEPIAEVPLPPVPRNPSTRGVQTTSRPPLVSAPSDMAGKGRLAEAVPRKRNDALAEAWGMHEPEPFEEFMAGGGSGYASAASSIHNGKEGHNVKTATASPRRTRGSKEEHLAPPVPRRRTTKNQLPPPKPIFANGYQEVSAAPAMEESLSSSPPTGGSNTKRSRSIMHRIRKMRETPNVPVNDDDDSDPSPDSSLDIQAQSRAIRASRPVNRGTGNSFLGRFGRSPPANFSPTSDGSGSNFVLIDDSAQKTLPNLPPDTPESGKTTGSNGDYFDRSTEDASGGGGLVRKTSLMRKVVRGVKRTGKT